jgi:hypothetical protein
MGTHAIPLKRSARQLVRVRVDPSLGHRDRLTTGFRFFLAIPHMLLVGTPIAAAMTWSRTSEAGVDHSWSAGGGVLGAVALVCALIAWFAIVFTGKAPEGLMRLGAFYLRWRVRASAYIALLRDEYPPFGDAAYPAHVELPVVAEPRDRLTVAFRPILVIPHLLAIWAIGFAWAITTIIAWFAILFTGEYPALLYHFATGALRWTTRVEAYLLLLTDDYPPFSLE